METQNEQPTIQEGQEPQGKPKVMFIEYTEWKKGQHAISAIIKGPGERHGRVAARIFIDFAGEPKKAIYTARDNEGNNLYPPTEKLWELKKTIKENAKTLYNKVHPEINALAKAKQATKSITAPQKAQGIEKPIVEGGKKVEGAIKKAAPETARKQELKNVRERKEEQNKGREQER
jgi:hypothetical protein